MSSYHFGYNSYKQLFLIQQLRCLFFCNCTFDIAVVHHDLLIALELRGHDLLSGGSNIGVYIMRDLLLAVVYLWTCYYSDLWTYNAQKNTRTVLISAWIHYVTLGCGTLWIKQRNPVNLVKHQLHLLWKKSNKNVRISMWNKQSSLFSVHSSLISTLVITGLGARQECTLHIKRQFSVDSPPIGMFLGDKRKPENPEEPDVENTDRQ